jgi:hypothetical protein
VTIQIRNMAWLGGMSKPSVAFLATDDARCIPGQVIIAAGGKRSA